MRIEPRIPTPSISSLSENLVLKIKMKNQRYKEPRKTLLPANTFAFLVNSSSVGIPAAASCFFRTNCLM